MRARRHVGSRGAPSPGFGARFVLRALLGVLVALAVAFGAGGAAARSVSRSAAVARTAVTAGQGAAQLEAGRAARAANAQPSKVSGTSRTSRATADGDALAAAIPPVSTSRHGRVWGLDADGAGPPAAWERPSYPTRDRARLMVFTN